MVDSDRSRLPIDEIEMRCPIQTGSSMDTGLRLNQQGTLKFANQKLAVHALEWHD